MRNVTAVLNLKGGCGKSSLSIHVSETLALHGLKTIVVDSDPQGTSSLWGRMGKLRTEVISIEPEEMAAELSRLSSEYDYVVVDCMPSLTARGTLAAIEAAGMVLIPCQTSTPDLWATTAVLDVVSQRRPDLVCLVVPNAVAATTVSREVLELMASTWHVSQSHIGARTCYREAAALGTTVHSMRGRAAAMAAKEISNLTIEVLATLNRSAQ